MKFVILIIWGIVILVVGRYFILNFTPQKAEDTHFPTEDDTYQSSATEVEDFFRYYFVKPGETLPQIARRYKININTIISLNNLKSYKLSSGQVLIIPKTDGITYRIREGESLWSLSKKFGVPVAEIKQVNYLDSNIIRSGDSLYLPGVKYSYIQQENNLKKRKYHHSKKKFRIFKKKKIKYESLDYSLNSESEGFIFPTIGRISSKYGYRRGRFHSGIDISGSLNTPIYAAADGVVKYTGWYGSYGKVIIIAHKNNKTTLYGHNSKNLVKEGDIVKKGQVIGLMGRSGNATGSHLHFEVRQNNKCINPLDVIK